MTECGLHHKEASLAVRKGTRSTVHIVVKYAERSSREVDVVYCSFRVGIPYTWRGEYSESLRRRPRSID